MSQTLPEAALGLPCHKYIARNLKNDKDIVEFERSLVDSMSSFGYSDDDIEAALLMMPTCIPPKSSIYGKDFSVKGARDLGDLLPSIRFDSTIPTYKSCGKYYKKWDPKTSICELCFFSKKNRNRKILSEEIVIRFSYAAKENYDYVIRKGITPDHFHAVIDVLDSFPGQKPCLFDLYKVAFNALFSSEKNYNEYFSTISDKLFTKGIANHIIGRLKRHKLPEQFLSKDWSVKFLDYMQSIIIIKQATPKDIADEAIDDLMFTHLQSTAAIADTNNPQTVSSGVLIDEMIMQNNQYHEEMEDIISSLEDEFVSENKKNAASHAEHMHIHAIVDPSEGNTKKISKPRIEMPDDLGLKGLDTIDKLDKTIENEAISAKDGENDIMQNIQDDSTDVGSVSLSSFSSEDSYEADAPTDDSFQDGGIYEYEDLGGQEFEDFSDVSDIPPSHNYSDKVLVNNTSKIGECKKDNEKSSDYAFSFLSCYKDTENNLASDEELINAIPVESRTVDPLEEMVYFHHTEDMINNYRIEEWELDGCLDLDKGNYRTLSRFESDVLRDQRLYVEPVVSGKNTVLLFWMPISGCFSFSKIKKSPEKEIILPLLSSKKIKKICFSPFKLYSYIRFMNGVMQNVYSIQGAERLIEPKGSDISILATMQKYHILPAQQGKSFFSAMKLSSLPFQFMPGYASVVRHQQGYIHKYRLQNEYEEEQCLEEGLGYSYVSDICSGERYQLKPDGIIFNPNLNIKKEGQALIYESSTAQDFIFLHWISILAKRGRFRKYPLKVLYMDSTHIVFYIGKEESSLLMSEVNYSLLDAKRDCGVHYLEMSTEVRAFTDSFSLSHATNSGKIAEEDSETLKNTVNSF